MPWLDDYQSLNAMTTGKDREREKKFSDITNERRI